MKIKSIKKVEHTYNKIIHYNLMTTHYNFSNLIISSAALIPVSKAPCIEAQ